MFPWFIIYFLQVCFKSLSNEHDYQLFPVCNAGRDRALHNETKWYFQCATVHYTQCKKHDHSFHRFWRTITSMGTKDNFNVQYHIDIIIVWMIWERIIHRSMGSVWWNIIGIYFLVPQVRVTSISHLYWARRALTHHIIVHRVTCICLLPSNRWS